MRRPIIDLHQDLLAHIRSTDNFSLVKQTSFRMLEQVNAKITIATSFPLPASEDQMDPVCVKLIEEDLVGYDDYCLKNSKWRIIKTVFDLDDVLATDGLHGLILHVEGLNHFDGSDWEMLERWYKLGLRSLGMVWNLSNQLGGGASDPSGGLTELGVEVIKWLHNKKMIVDFAHMNKETFWQALEYVKGPVIVSHANAQSLCTSPRNLDDDQLKAVADSGGVVGLFVAKTFVTGRDLPGSAVDAANHLEYMAEVMGREHVALGTDFGGIYTGLLQGLEDVTRIDNLFDELKRRGWDEEEIESIAWKNANRVLRNILG